MDGDDKSGIYYVLVLKNNFRELAMNLITTLSQVTKVYQGASIIYKYNTKVYIIIF